MHIVHVIDSLAIGGAERMLVEIANASVADGHRVGVCITRSSRTDLTKELDKEIDLIVLKRTKRFDLAALRDYIRFIQDRQFQIIHVHGRSSFSFCAVASMLHQNRIPIVLHDHKGSIETDEKIPTWFRLWGRRYVAKYIGVYEKVRAWALTAGVAPKDISIIENGINIERATVAPVLDIRQELDIDATALVGIVVAGLRPEKGIDLLIESLSRCDKLNIKVLVVGGSRNLEYVQYCRKLAEERNVAEYFIFTGERLDVASLNQAVDFGLVPSRSESGPLVLIEYLASGLPIVAFRVGGIAQAAAIHGVQGIVDPNDLSAFANALATLVGLSSKERRERGQYGQRVAQKCFSIQPKMALFYKIYHEALHNE